MAIEDRNGDVIELRKQRDEAFRFSGELMLEVSRMKRRLARLERALVGMVNDKVIYKKHGPGSGTPLGELVSEFKERREGNNGFS